MFESFKNLDLYGLETPSFVISLEKLEENFKLLKYVEEKSSATVLMALKAFSCYETFDLAKKYLSGTSSSGLNEAMLANQYFGGSIHVYSPAFPKSEVEKLCEFADTIIFNSSAEIKKHSEAIKNSKRKISVGIRVNPEYAEVETEIYNPCAPKSRLGSMKSLLPEDITDSIDGIHFHAMCEQGVDVLERILAHFEEKFDDLIKKVSWVNLGGGHHITKEGYDVEKLIGVIQNFRKKYPNLKRVYLEPGEAIALNAGIFVSEVLTLHKNQCEIAVLDCSATCHMPDVLEMPYRPQILNAGESSVKAYTYRLGGRSCLAGDVIGDYSFDEELKEGMRLVFGDMAIYSMVKTSTFNGMNLPSIYIWNGKTAIKHKSFGYEEFKARL